MRVTFSPLRRLVSSSLRFSLLAGLSGGIALQAASLSANGMIVDIDDGVISEITYGDFDFLNADAHRSGVLNASNPFGSFHMSDRYYSSGPGSLNFAEVSSSATSATYETVLDDGTNQLLVLRTYTLDSVSAAVDVQTTYQNLGGGAYQLETAEVFSAAASGPGFSNFWAWHDARLLGNGHQITQSRTDTGQGAESDHTFIAGTGDAGANTHGGTLNDGFGPGRLSGLANYTRDDDESDYGPYYNAIGWTAVLADGESFETTFRIAVGEDVATAEQAYLSSSTQPPPAVPEPASLLLLGLGAGAGLWAKRRRQA